jgi:hypothetical protein
MNVQALIMFGWVLAWVGGVLSALMIAIKIAAAITETELERRLARARGVELTYPIQFNVMVVVICAAYIVAFW